MRRSTIAPDYRARLAVRQIELAPRENKLERNCPVLDRLAAVSSAMSAFEPKPVVKRRPGIAPFVTQCGLVERYDLSADEVLCDWQEKTDTAKASMPVSGMSR